MSYQGKRNSNINLYGHDIAEIDKLVRYMVIYLTSRHIVFSNGLRHDHVCNYVLHIVMPKRGKRYVKSISHYCIFVPKYSKCIFNSFQEQNLSILFVSVILVSFFEN